MRQTLAQPLPATPRERLADVSGRDADRPRAELHPQPSATRLRDVAAEALQQVTSQKAAAIDIDLSEGRLSHKLKDGTLTLAQLETLGPTYAVKFGEQLIEQFAPLATPKARARQQLRDAERCLRELDQVLELLP